MTPTWHNDKLVPTGKLTLIPESIKVIQSSVIGIAAEAIDEIGAVWPLGSRMFMFEVKPVKWPPVLDGIYCLKRIEDRTIRWRIRAQTLAQAIEEARKSCWNADEVEIVLETITRPRSDA